MKRAFGPALAADGDEEIQPLLGESGAEIRLREGRQKRPRELVDLLAFRLERQQLSELLVADRLLRLPRRCRRFGALVDRLDASQLPQFVGIVLPWVHCHRLSGPLYRRVVARVVPCPTVILQRISAFWWISPQATRTVSL